MTTCNPRPQLVGYFIFLLGFPNVVHVFLPEPVLLEASLTTDCALPKFFPFFGHEYAYRNLYLIPCPSILALEVNGRKRGHAEAFGLSTSVGKTGIN